LKRNVIVHGRERESRRAQFYRYATRKHRRLRRLHNHPRLLLIFHLYSSVTLKWATAPTDYKKAALNAALSSFLLKWATPLFEEASALNLHGWEHQRSYSYLLSSLGRLAQRRTASRRSLVKSKPESLRKRTYVTGWRVTREKLTVCALSGAKKRPPLSLIAEFHNSARHCKYVCRRWKAFAIGNIHSPDWGKWTWEWN
jgi:hypothetical protein